VRELLAQGVAVDEIDNRGYTPLVLAAINRNVDVLQMLIEHKADVNRKDNHGYTVLGAAAATGNEEMVRLLLDNGALINEPGLHGHTPLIQAIMVGSDDMVRLLLEKGADPAAKGTDGRTALEWAVICSNTKIGLLPAALESGRCAIAEKENAVSHVLAMTRQERLKKRPGYKLKIGPAR
jgi:hypothetical protein